MWGQIIAGALQLGFGTAQAVTGFNERKRAEADLRKLAEQEPELYTNQYAQELTRYPGFKQAIEEEGLRASEAISLYAMQRDNRFMSMAPKFAMTTAIERRKSMYENEMIRRSGLQVASQISQRNQELDLENWRMALGFANERRGSGIYGMFQGMNAAGLGAASTTEGLEKLIG
jgi:hypothetical protein